MPTLRTPNNPITSAILLAGMQQIIPAQTALTTVNPADPTGISVVFVRSRYAMATKGLFPAVNLTTGSQKSNIEAQLEYAGPIVVNITYYNRWDQNNLQTQEEIIVAMDADLERIQANLEDWSSAGAAIGTIPYAISIPGFSISPDKGEIDNTFPGTPLLGRTLQAMVNRVGYGVGRAG